MRCKHKAFTLVELLMVIFIIGLLMTLLTSAVQSARETARRAHCLHKMNQVAAAIQQFESAQKHYPGWRHYPFNATDVNTGQPITFSTSWPPQLLPYLGRNDIFQPGQPGNWKSPIVSGGTPVGFAPNMRAALVCPSDAARMSSGSSVMSYVVNTGRRDASATASVPADWRANGVFLNLLTWRGHPDSRVHVVRSDSSFIRQGDGLSTTLLLSENYDAGPWHNSGEARSGFIFYPPGVQPRHHINSPTIIRTRPSFLNARPASYHPGGVNVAFAGMNARFLRQDIDYTIYCALMTPRGASAMEPGTTQASAASITNQPQLPPE
jgi:prepilin-type N-terminal cleavage/methylation domain-containing protein